MFFLRIKRTLPLFVGTVFVVCASVAVAGSSSIVLSRDGHTLCAVNQDGGSISLWEWKTKAEPVEIPVGEEPRMIAVSPHAGEVYVTTQRSQELVVVDLATKRVSSRIAIGGQPVGVVVSPDGRKAWVAQFAGDYLEGEYCAGAVAIVDLVGRTVEKRIAVKPCPFAMTFSVDGLRLYVTHFFQRDGLGWVSEIDVENGRVLREFSLSEDKDIAGGRGGVFNALAGLTVHPNGKRLLVAGMHANVHRGEEQSGKPLSHKTTVQAAVRVIDLTSGRELESARMVSSFSGQAVAVPSAVSFLPDGKHFLDIYFASHDMKVLAYNEMGFVAERALFELPDGPSGVVVSDDGERAFVNCRWTRSIAHVSLEDIRKPRLIREQRIAKQTWSSQRLLGARVFHDTRDTRMTPNRWLSCGVCHLEGGVLSDNLQWEFTEKQKPSSPRLMNTKSLAVTAWSGPPFLIQGTYATVHEEEKFIRSFLRGRGFLRGNATSEKPFPRNPRGVSAELDGLSEFVLSLRPRPNPHMAGDKPRREILARARRGRKLFFDERVACFRCHRGRYLTRSGSEKNVRLADVGTGIRADVPSLVNVWETAPYLHDGRAKTLEEVVTVFNPHDQHGMTSHLNEKQIDDLIGFLLAPFEVGGLTTK